MYAFILYKETIDWLLLITILTMIVLLAFGCASPFAAIIGVSMLFRSDRTVLLSVIVSWLVNQAVGFTLFSFPVTTTSIAWGAIILAAGVISSTISILINKFLSLRRFGMVIFYFHLAFIVYQLCFFCASFFTQDDYNVYTLNILLGVYKKEIISLFFFMIAGLIGDKIDRKQKTMQNMVS
ncbi:MAG: hypothetical protein RL596_1706 [Bacteroidota bacterium]|jgi:hypothetical protein